MIIEAESWAISMYIRSTHFIRINNSYLVPMYMCWELLKYNLVKGGTIFKNICQMMNTKIISATITMTTNFKFQSCIFGLSIFVIVILNVITFVRMWSGEYLDDYSLKLYGFIPQPFPSFDFDKWIFFFNLSKSIFMANLSVFF